MNKKAGEVYRIQRTWKYARSKKAVKIRQIVNDIHKYTWIMEIHMISCCVLYVACGRKLIYTDFI